MDLVADRSPGRVSVSEDEAVANLPVSDEGDRVSVVLRIEGGKQVDTFPAARGGLLDRIGRRHHVKATATLLIAVVGTSLYFLPVAEPATETAIRGGAVLFVFIGLWLV